MKDFGLKQANPSLLEGEIRLKKFNQISDIKSLYLCILQFVSPKSIWAFSYIPTMPLHVQIS